MPIIIITTIDVRYYNIVESRHTKKPKPNYMPRICLGLTQNLEKHLMKMTKNGSKRKIQEISYEEHLITTKQETSIREKRKENNNIIPEKSM
jgi:hypothetical protein